MDKTAVARKEMVYDDALLARAFHCINEPLVILSQASSGELSSILYANPAFTRLTGYSLEEIMGKGLRLFQGVKTDNSFLANLAGGVQEFGFARGCTVHYRKDASEFVNEWQVSAVLDKNGVVSHWVCSFRDISERKLHEEDLIEQKTILEQKNASLREILELVEIEKKKIKENVSNNVEVVVLPALTRLGRTRTRNEKKYLGIIEEHLKDLTSTFGSQLAQPNYRLSPREVEIANLVKSGMSSKDIGTTLGISIKTVETIRNKIRKKLGLVNRSVNLTSYFRSA